MRKSTIFGLTAGLAFSAGLVFAATTVNNPAPLAEDETAGEVVYPIIPAAGSCVQEISEIKVTFEGRVGFTEVNPGNAVLENVSTGDAWYCTAPLLKGFDAEGNAQYSLTFTEKGGETAVTIDEAGFYTLTLKGFYNGESEDEDGDTVYNYLDPVTYNYTIYPIELGIYPANGSYLATSNFTTVDLEFGEAVALDNYVDPDNVENSSVVLVNTTTNDTYVGQFALPGRGGATNYSIEFVDFEDPWAEVVFKAGEYTLTIQNIVYASGELPNIVANYTLVEPVAYTLNPNFDIESEDYVNAVSSVSSVTITFENPNVGFNDVYPGVAVLENTSTGDAWYCTDPYDNGRNEDGYRSFTFTFHSIDSTDDVTVDAAGNYTLSIMGAYQTIMDEDVVVAEIAQPVISAGFAIVPQGLVNITPESGLTVTDLSTVTVTFDTMFAGYTTPSRLGITLENTTTGVVYTGEEPMQSRNEAGEPVFTITFLNEDGTPATIEEIGAYTLTLPNFYVNLAEDAEAEEIVFEIPTMTAEYTLIPAGYATFDPDNGSTVESLSTINVTLQGRVGFEESYPATALLENTSSGDIYVAMPLFKGYDVDAEGNPYSMYELTFTEMGGEEPVDIIEVGTYVLSLRGFYITLNDITEDEDAEEEKGFLPALVATYDLVPEGFYSLLPASGTTVSEIETITLTFQGRVGYTEAYPGNAILENTSTGNAWYCTTPLLQGYDEDGNSIYALSFYETGGETPATIDEIGNYVLTIRGFYNSVSYDEEGDEVPNYLPVFTAGYTILPEGFVTFDPEAGSTVNDLSKVTVTFEGRVGFTEGRNINAMLENTTSGEVWSAVPFLNGYDENGNSIYSLDFSDSVEVDGETVEVLPNILGSYTLTLRGFYNSASQDESGEELPFYLPVITVNYTVYPEGFYTFTPAEGSEVENLSTVVLTINKQPNAGIDAEVRPAPAILENVATGDVWYCENPIKNRLADSSSAFTMDFSELGSSSIADIYEDGEYLLTVKGLYITEFDPDNGDEEGVNFDLPNITATFYIVGGTSGIQQVIDADTYNVYGINGVQYLNNGKASDLNSLNPGLYIINGKKVIIRK